MATILNTVSQLFLPEKAEALAQYLNADPEEDWTYQAIHDPRNTGYSKIAIFDENGNHMGYL